LTDREIIHELLHALEAAVDDLIHWGTYAPGYFQNKWGLHQDIENHRKVIEEVKEYLDKQ
jgi:hypothetical protein